MPFGWAAGAAAVGTIGAAVIGSNATQSAADTQANAANSSTAFQEQMFQSEQNNLAPFLTSGTNSLAALQQLYGLTPTSSGATGPGSAAPAQTPDNPSVAAARAANPSLANAPVYMAPQGEIFFNVGGQWVDNQGQPASNYGVIVPASAAAPGGTSTAPVNSQNVLNSPLLRAPTTADFQSSPGYNFQLQQGTNAITNNASALGGVNSGNTLKALQGYGTGLANQDYWNFYNAFTGNQNRVATSLGSLAGAGQNAAANLGSAGSNLGTQVGNNNAAAANATSANSVAQGNIQNNALQSLLNGGSFQNLFGSSNLTPGATNLGFTSGYADNPNLGY